MADLLTRGLTHLKQVARASAKVVTVRVSSKERVVFEAAGDGGERVIVKVDTSTTRLAHETLVLRHCAHHKLLVPSVKYPDSGDPSVLI
ncbi:MAG TPA: hypothetical protein VMS08_05865, partial [Candidatus Saccharimonadia bacterium]|nr:hypothetical protein [Candidatus Saccharimonadia bacterium]